MARAPRPLAGAGSSLLKYLVDTNVLSEPVRPQPRSQVTDWLEARFSECATSSVVWHELSYGARRLPEFERARLANLGLTPPAADSQIASVAVTQGLTLVTFNGADYRHFAGLQIENPLKA